eukprot:2511462-Alexandrium_andersonii.AAC.1
MPAQSRQLRLPRHRPPSAGGTRRASTSRADAPPAAATQAPRLVSRSPDPRHHGAAPQLPRRAPQRAVVRLECHPSPQCSRPRAGGPASGPAP